MYDFFHNTDIGLVILTFLEALAVLVPLLIGVAYLTLAERKVLADTPLGSSVANYYVTDPISRSSPTMAACVEAQTTPAPTPHVMAAE